MADNVKIQTKVQSFEDVQKSLQDIEKNFNKLTKAVNQTVEDERKETEGKSGDIQSINIGSDGGKDYSLEIKSSNGWQAPVLKPHYDSGWKDVTKNNRYTYKHNLGSKILLVQVYFKTDAHQIFNLSHIGFSEAAENQSNTDMGLAMQMHNENTISIGFARYHITAHENVPADDEAWQWVDDGYLRLLIWKTGIIR
tara:strand:- start:51 stop:638 length:588 start_codon:yes stop_codon:yes gene_type:complete